MIRAKVDPDEVTFTGLLSACSHSGIWQKGSCCFEYISQYKSSSMKLQHYICMVDILDRCGKLEEAEELIKNMQVKANSTGLLASLSACRMHSNLELAERATKSILDHLEPHCNAAYVLLSKYICFCGVRHEFVSGDRSHPLIEKINQKLDGLGGKLKVFGYVPDERFALHDVEDEQKQEVLSYHNERLPIAFALATTAKGSTITVMKNLCMWRLP
ncbi:hypothetical protein CRYUN_Cryun32bG0057300 [Craigia yunnanensis]